MKKVHKKFIVIDNNNRLDIVIIEKEVSVSCDVRF